jgi:Trehalose receptor
VFKHAIFHFFPQEASSLHHLLTRWEKFSLGSQTRNMKVGKTLSAKLHDIHAEVRKYRLRPSEDLGDLFLICFSNKQSFVVKLSFPQRGTREDFLYNGTFHEAVGLVLTIAQFFGIMPVSGVRENLPQNVKFRKFSFRFIWSLTLIIGLVTMLVLEALWLFDSQVEFGKIVNLLFDSTNLLSIFCFLELGMKWPKLIVKWNEVEKYLPQLRYQFDKQKMAYEIKMASFAILTMSMGR